MSTSCERREMFSPAWFRTMSSNGGFPVSVDDSCRSQTDNFFRVDDFFIDFSGNPFRIPLAPTPTPPPDFPRKLDLPSLLPPRRFCRVTLNSFGVSKSLVAKAPDEKNQGISQTFA